MTTRFCTHGFQNSTCGICDSTWSRPATPLVKPPAAQNRACESASLATQTGEKQTTNTMPWSLSSSSR